MAQDEGEARPSGTVCPLAADGKHRLRHTPGGYLVIDDVADGGLYVRVYCRCGAEATPRIELDDLTFEP